MEYCQKQQQQMNSKQQQISVPKYQNFLTSQNNVSLISCTSEHNRGKAINILSSNPRQLWLTNEKLPQEIIFSLKKINKRPPCFNMIGIYCWHQYDSNPALAEVWLKLEETTRWELVGKVRLARVSVWQYFKIQQFEAKSISQVKIKVAQNFGGDSTYINKIGLFYSNQKSSLAAQIPLPTPQSLEKSPDSHHNIQPLYPSQARPKTHSEHQNLSHGHGHVHSHAAAQLQKELKRANEQISYLVEEQQEMKKTILEQEKVIITIQETLKKVLMTMDKMQKIQDLQTKIQSRVNSKDAKVETHNKDKRGSQAKIQDSQNGHRNRASLNDIDDYEFQNEEQSKPKKQRKNHRENPRQNTTSNRNQIEQFKNMLNSFQKHATPKVGYPMENNQTEVIRTNSEQELSEYSHKNSHYQSQNDYQFKKYQTDQAKDKNKENRGDKAKMVERLVKLIELKEKKKMELKKSATKMGSSWGKSRKYDYQGDEEEEDDEGYDE